MRRTASEESSDLQPLNQNDITPPVVKPDAFDAVLPAKSKDFSRKGSSSQSSTVLLSREELSALFDKASVTLKAEDAPDAELDLYTDQTTGEISNEDAYGDVEAILTDMYETSPAARELIGMLQEEGEPLDIFVGELPEGIEPDQLDGLHIDTASLQDPDHVAKRLIEEILNRSPLYQDSSAAFLDQIQDETAYNLEV